MEEGAGGSELGGWVRQHVAQAGEMMHAAVQEELEWGEYHMQVKL